MPSVDHKSRREELLAKLPPATRQTTLANMIDPKHFAHSPTIKSQVEAYVNSCGIPSSALKGSLPASLASAFCSPNYLKAWRNRINPNWALLGGDDDDNATDYSDTVTRPPEPPPLPVGYIPAVPTDGSAGLTKAQLASIYAQAEVVARKATIDALREGRVQLDESAKEQIRTIAKREAQDIAERAALKIMAENATPRVIEISDKVTGETRNLGLQHEHFPLLLRAMQAKDHRGFRLNVWLTGPTGSGKTSACEAAAKALNLPFGSDGSLDADYKVLGFRNAQGEVVSTQFLTIYVNGGVYVADEIDNWFPSALLALNAALANGFVATPDGLVRRHKDCIVVACANTWGLGATNEYVGRAKQDAASLDRFHPKLDWPVDTKLERAIAVEHGGEVGSAWHTVVATARAKAQGQGLKIIISPRATFAGISLLTQGFTPMETVGMTFLAGVSAEQSAPIIASINPAIAELGDILISMKEKEIENLPSDDFPLGLLMEADYATVTPEAFSARTTARSREAILSEMQMAAENFS